MSQSIATDAQRIVLDAAGPSAGRTIARQMQDAARALGYRAGSWRVRAAWYCEAGAWSAAAVEDLRERYRTWREKQGRLASAEASKLASVYRSIAAQLERTDAEFHAADVASLIALAGKLDGGERREAEQDDGALK